MTYEIEVTEVVPRMIGAIKVTTNRRKIGDDIAAGFGALMRVMGTEGVDGAGPPLVVYHGIIDEETDGEIEICIPIAGELTGDGGVYGRELEGGTVATTLHRGPYQELAAAYQTLMVWIPEQGHKIAGPPREFYLNDPHTVAPDEILTRIEFPIG